MSRYYQEEVDGLKELYEIVTVADVGWKCFYKYYKFLKDLPYNISHRLRTRWLGYQILIVLAGW